MANYQHIAARDLTQDHFDATLRIAVDRTRYTLIEPVGVEGQDAVELIVINHQTDRQQHLMVNGGVLCQVWTRA